MLSLQTCITINTQPETDPIVGLTLIIRAQRVSAIVLIIYLMVIPVYLVKVVNPSKENKRMAFEEMEEELPLPVKYKSFRNYTTPPYIIKENLVTNKSTFMKYACGEETIAIYKEQDYWMRHPTYYVAVYPANQSTYILVYEYVPDVVEIDNGFLKPKTYEIKEPQSLVRVVPGRLSCSENTGRLISTAFPWVPNNNLLVISGKIPRGVVASIPNENVCGDIIYSHTKNDGLI